MWIKVEQQISHKVIIDDGVIPGITKGIYSTTVQYRGIEDNANLMIFTLGGKYIISNTLGDSIDLDSNYPNITTGTYSLDSSKKPNGSNTVYTNGNKFVVVNSSKIIYYGDYLMPNDNKHERVRFDWNGNDLTYQRVFESGVNEFDQVDITAQALSDTEFVITEAEYDTGTRYNDVVNAAFAAFDAKGYYYTFSPVGSFNGWYSDTLKGVYEPFGTSTGQKKVGHFQYRDVNNNEYVKTKEITENNSVWSVTSKINNEVYTTATEPQDSDITFSNSDVDPTTLELTFETYVALPKKQILTMLGDDLR